MGKGPPRVARRLGGRLRRSECGHTPGASWCHTSRSPAGLAQPRSQDASVVPLDSGTYGRSGLRFREPTAPCPTSMGTVMHRLLLPALVLVVASCGSAQDAPHTAAPAAT